jgi:hypothetical protein
VALTGLNQVADFLNAFREERVKLGSGPVSAKLLSYWPTLDQDASPLLYSDFAPLVRSPPTSPHGVPAGTIIAWIPKAGDIIDTPTGKAIAVPEGWLLCDGHNGTPDLQGRFIRGTSNPNEIRAPSGLAEFTPTGDSRFKGYAEGEISWARIQGRNDPYSPVHSLRISPVPLIPPTVSLVFIMKN